MDDEHIAVWLDEDTDSNVPVWVVSIQYADQSSFTKFISRDHREAIGEAIKLSLRTGMPVVQ